MVPIEKIQELSEGLLSGDKHLSHSSLSAFIKSPAHFLQYKFGEKKKSDAFRVGNLVDTLLLEPKEFETRYAIFDESIELPHPDKDYRNKENKAARLKFMDSVASNIEVITKIELSNAEDVVKQIRKIKAADGILSMCDEFQKEGTFKYEGFKFLYRKDASCYELNIDLKTTKDASQRGFKRAITQYGYHRQAYLYNYGDGNEMKPYFIIAIEKEPPYAASVHRISDKMMMQGKRQIDKALNGLRRCLLNNELFYQSYEFWAAKTHGIFEVEPYYFR